MGRPLKDATDFYQGFQAFLYLYPCSLMVNHSAREMSFKSLFSALYLNAVFRRHPTGFTLFLLCRRELEVRGEGEGRLIFSLICICSTCFASCRSSHGISTFLWCLPGHTDKVTFKWQKAMVKVYFMGSSSSFILFVPGNREKPQTEILEES